jgi:hypothetical protein
LSQIFEETIQRGTSFDRSALRQLAAHPQMGANAPLVYIYSLAPDAPSIPYPKRPGRTVYIGETQRETGSWQRFPAHFSASLTDGLSTLINHTLSIYYHAGTALRLKIFRVIDGRPTPAAERIILTAHLHAFGAYPLGQGGTGRANTPKEVTSRFLGHEELHTYCVGLFG